MITFLSNSKNDLQLTNGGDMALISGLAGIAQVAAQFMQARQGEMFLALPDGIPYESVLWAGTPNIAQFEAAGRATLLRVPQVVEVLSFDAQLDDGVLSYTANIRTDLGTTTVNG
jgi:hypothetical protein